MPSLLDIRRRIRAVKSTQQITKAMKMVAASRLRRAQERVQQARPYANEMQHLLHRLAARVDQAKHQLLDQRQASRAGGKPLVFLITADRGLCGSFNTNAIKAASTFIVEDPVRDVALGLVGRRGRDFFGRRGFEVRYESVNLFQSLNYEHAHDIAAAAMGAFTEGAVDRVYLIYNEFKSVIQQRIVVERLLPIPTHEVPGGFFHAGAGPSAMPETAAAPQVDYLFEPTADKVLADLLPRHVEVQVFRALLESNAAFYAAQMTAMDSASRNAADMIDQLTLYMNKVRQAAITREIIEVVSGAEAL